MDEPHISRYEEINLDRLRTYPMAELSRKVQLSEFAQPFQGDITVARFAKSLPKILKGAELTEFASMIATASQQKKPVIVMHGGHLVKTGLAPLLIDWFDRGIVTSIATNGSSIIHDTELALYGRTSEDVAEGLAEGKFGMVKETADFINGVIANPSNRRLGFGEALGKELTGMSAPYAELSLLCGAYRNNLPMTVHVAIGTDIIHQHPSANGEAIGRASMRDFRIFTRQVGRLCEGAVVMNIGSAVIMPEVFLKALSIARNLGYPSHKFATANFDMFSHYRPTQNVLNRPTLTGGKKFSFTGHHEIQIPLLYAFVNSALQDSNFASK